MQNLQRPCPARVPGKLLIWRVGTYFSWLERCPVTAEVASSSLVVPAILFKELPDVTPETPTHNPTHIYCTVTFIPTAVRNSPCAARVSSLSSCVYRSRVV